MFKRFFVMGALALMVGLLAACGGESETNSKSEENAETKTESKTVEVYGIEAPLNEDGTVTISAEDSPFGEEATIVYNQPKESEKPFPEGTNPMGDGTIVITTPAGNSEDGNIPVMWLDEETMITSVSMDLGNFDGNRLTYIYVNGIYMTSEQVGELTQTSLDIGGDDHYWMMKPGTYTVTAVQFENDDVNGTPTHFVQATYEIKQK